MLTKVEVTGAALADDLIVVACIGAQGLVGEPHAFWSSGDEVALAVTAGLQGIHPAQ